MSRLRRGAAMVGLVAFGYMLGAAGVLTPAFLNAQGKPAKEGPSDDASTAIRAADDALKQAQALLQNDQRYTAATTGFNAFAILSGGVNAVDDLESNRGVDPETFAGLYAGLAEDSVRSKLATDGEGRLTYDGKVVRMYPISRLKQMFAERDRLMGIKPKKGTKGAP